MQHGMGTITLQVTRAVCNVIAVTPAKSGCSILKPQAGQCLGLKLDPRTAARRCPAASRRIFVPIVASLVCDVTGSRSLSF